ncbi:peptidase S8 [Glaciibacter flavus]|uniref:Peptidase S8 n=1 Tax=Orlajensenia flava TaxID=2565934 RepID=A0A4S4G145_9MICO|nr:S8 family serine peptidase [Glaciibacter flavus]THG36192.1 peptidase S8 [Glaciibacter flavus]
MVSARGRWLGGVAIAAAVLALGVAPVVVDDTPAHADQVRDLEYWLSDYGFTSAWNTSKGAGVKVAVIDTGVDGTVAELRGVVVGGTDASGTGAADGQKPVGQDSDHGTMVSSLLAGRGTGTGNGVLGVAPEATLLSASVAFGAEDGAGISTDDQIAAAVKWSVDAGAKVINMSLTRNTLDWPESWDDAFLYAFEHDVVVVAAAGNRGEGTSQVGAPATIPGVVAVAGVDRNRQASFDASSQGITISVAAPSEDLVGVVPGGGYVKWSGTSGAAPIVSGLIALVRSAYPDLDAANAIQRVVATANPDGHTVPSPIYGNGLIDAKAALTATVAPATTTPADQLKEWIRIHRRAQTPSDQTAAPTPVAVAPTPDPAVPKRDVGALLLPNVLTLNYLTVPFAVLLGFATLVVLLGIGASRHIKRTLRKQATRDP